jgi:hypothetical protein
MNEHELESLREQNTALRDELAELKAELARLRTREQKLVATAGTVGRGARRIVFGPELDDATLGLVRDLRSGERVHDESIANFAAAVIRRLIRVGIVALALGLLPTILVTAQTLLLSAQNEKLDNQNALLATQNEQVAMQTLASRVDAALALSVEIQRVGDTAAPLENLRRAYDGNESMLETCQVFTRSGSRVDIEIDEAAGVCRTLSAQAEKLELTPELVSAECPSTDVIRLLNLLQEDPTEDDKHDSTLSEHATGIAAIQYVGCILQEGKMERDRLVSGPRTITGAAGPDPVDEFRDDLNAAQIACGLPPSLVKNLSGVASELLILEESALFISSAVVSKIRHFRLPPPSDQNTFMGLLNLEARLESADTRSVDVQSFEQNVRRMREEFSSLMSDAIAGCNARVERLNAYLNSVDLTHMSLPADRIRLY